MVYNTSDQYYVAYVPNKPIKFGERDSIIITRNWYTMVDKHLFIQVNSNSIIPQHVQYKRILYPGNDLKPDLVGVWEIDYLKITMSSFQNSDSVSVIEVIKKEWEQKMKMRNIQTYYNSDGTYHSVHRNLKDSIVYDPAGTWRIENDTLTIQDTFPKRVTYKFKLKVDKSFAEFWGIEDFDQDGKLDDKYYSKKRRIK